MPINNENHEDKTKELEEKLKNQECFEGYCYSQDITEKRKYKDNEYLETIGSFTFCGRRNLPLKPVWKISILEEQNYRLAKCKDCIYETSGKWQRDLIMEAHKVWNDTTHKMEKALITGYNREEIVAAIKEWIKNGASGEVIVKSINTKPKMEERDF